MLLWGYLFVMLDFVTHNLHLDYCYVLEIGATRGLLFYR